MVDVPTDSAKEGDDSPPVAYARAGRVWSRKGHPWELIVDVCPLCSRKHAHGGGTGQEPRYGVRASHCADRATRGFYQLRPAVAS